MPLDLPLVPPAVWPGVDLSYRFHVVDGAPTLTLHLAFEPHGLAGDEDALARHAALVAQLADPEIALRLDATVLPGATSGALRPVLAAFAEAAATELGGEAPSRREADVALAVDPRGVAALPDDVFEVRVRLTVGSATFELSRVAEWAAGFEAAFAGFDGAEGRLRALTGVDGDPWALRWSRTHGVWAEFPSAEAACFTFAPLSRELVSGSVNVVVYDPDTLAPAGERTISFSSLDLDVAGESFLTTLDTLLSPGMAAAIEHLDPGAHAELVGMGARMAKALSRGLVPVTPDAPAGDADAARGEFEQALQDSLARAYTTSAVVQLPASVRVAGQGSVALFGTITSRPQYTASAATLPPRAAYLTFQVYATWPRDGATVPLAGAYEVSHVRHPTDAGQWLELAGGVESLALPRLDVPVPLRHHPAPPVLMRQTGSAAIEPRGTDPVHRALEWDYVTELAVPDAGARDELRVGVTFGPTAGPEPARAPHAPAELAGALGGFRAAWSTLAPLLPRIAEDDRSGEGASPHEVLAAIMAQVRAVVDRWTSPAASAAMPPSGRSTAGSREVVIRFTASRLDVFARSSPAFDASRVDEWPSINEQKPVAPPDEGDGGYRCSYPYTAAPTLTLRWRSLDLLSQPVARGSFRVVRNAGLRDELVYRTAPVTFADPALPRIEVDHVGPIPSGASLEDTLAQVLRPVSKAGRGEQALDVAVSYEYPLDPANPALTATDPVLRAHRFRLDSLAALAQYVTTWHASSGHPATGATLWLQVDLERVLRLERVEIPVPPGWW